MYLKDIKASNEEEREHHFIFESNSAKSMTKIISFVLILLVLSLSGTNAASSCYSCNDCGTIWDATKVSVVPTTNANSYCRVSIHPLSFFISLFLFYQSRKQ